MIDFQPLTLEDRGRFEAYLLDGTERGCEYSFANLYLWGRQRAAEVAGHLVLFSQFSRRSIYPYPVGAGDKTPVLEEKFPGQFRFHCDRDSYDYVYAIDDLADLKGRKYQKKRNHFNRFREAYPHYTLEPLGSAHIDEVKTLTDRWFAHKLEEDPQGDYHMERAAISKALKHYEELGMEGLVLRDGADVLAYTLGSPLSPDTFDIHFEKARPEAEGAYPVINCEFARYLREKYPHIQYLNREDDLGLEGLRKAKLSYYPHHLVEKCWACLLEDGYDY